MRATRARGGVLLTAGFDRRRLHAYVILGHPNSAEQHVGASTFFAHELALRVVISAFSPISGNPDGELCRRWRNLAEPLAHNKTAFACKHLERAN